MIRAGHGYNAYRLVSQQRLLIGGVHIPYWYGLGGRFDGDVLVHTVIDALLGACALGGIKQNFPDDDPAYKGVGSIELLKRAAEMVGKNGYTVGNIDSTVVILRPDLSEFVEEMRRNISNACGISISAVSVKTGTEENLGFTGAHEGIAAHAVCILTAALSPGNSGK